MMICSDDLVQYKALMESDVDTYCIKLKSFLIRHQTPESQKNKDLVKMAREAKTK